MIHAIVFIFLLLSLGQSSTGKINENYFHKAKGTRFEGMSFNEEGSWQGPFFFIQMADCQLGMYEQNRSWDKEVENLERAVDHINRLRPKFVIVCGDLTHAKPYKKAYPYQVRDYKNAMSKISEDIPLVCVCGNHDVGNKPTTQTIQSYKDNFGSHYFSFWAGGTQCFVLNSSLYCNPSNAKKIFQKQKAWLEQEMIQSPPQPPVHRFVFTHHPWFIKDAETAASAYYEIPLERRLDAVRLFVNQGVTACFAGHYHRNCYASYQGMEMITTNALGKPFGRDPSGFRIVKVFEDGIDHQFYGLDQVPQSIEFTQEEVNL